MAVIYEQSDIDKTFTAHAAMEKIVKNYYEILGIVCIYDLTKRKELVMCLQDIAKCKPVGASQTAFVTQVNFLLDKLNAKKH